MRALLVLPLALVACAGRSAPITVACPSGSDVADLGADKPGAMTLNGTATLEIAPDTADMHITLAAELPRPKQAASSVRAKQQALSKALAAIGLASDDISLSYLSISPVYDEHGHLLDYSAAITVTASTHDFDRLAEIMEAAANSGATSTSTDFRVADMATLKKKVRAQALAALKDKADQMSSSLGIKLGRIRAVAENQGGDGWAWNGSVTVSNSVDFAPRAPTASGARAEAQSLTLTVSATYELT